MSGHGLQGGISNRQGEGRTFSFYITGQMVHFTGGKQRNKDHERRIGELLKCGRERFDPCCIHIVSFAINHHRYGGVMSSSAVERAAGSSQCK